MADRLSALDPVESEEEPKPRWRLPARPLSAAAALCAIAFQLFLLQAWIKGESRVPSWDQSIHLEIAKDYADHLSKGDVRGIVRMAPKPGMPPFPPLYYITLLPGMSANDPATAVLWANAFWLIILVGSIWGLGIIFAGPWEAAVAAILVSCLPETQWLTRNSLSDLALAATVAASYLAFARSGSFLSWPGSLAFGACAGAAMLVKWSAWTYLLPVAWIMARALRWPVSRRRTLAALAVAAAICAPWYLTQLPVLVPRLFEAASDQAVPVWRGWACLTYLWQMLSGFDTPLWALAMVALAVPHSNKNREDGWMMTAWFFTSLVFWTIVPNRQMRFLFPAVAPLLLRLPGIYPRALVAIACAWQLFGAANYTYGWVRPLSVNAGRPMPFFSAYPPVRADWRIADILKAAQSRVESDRPSVNLTVVANDERFNGPVFNWVRKQAGTLGVNIRGVNRRYCELSEFVVIKLGSLGPPAVVNQLPEVRDDMLAPGSWFLRGYEQAAKWSLPEGEAVLFQRRKKTAPPFKARALRFDALDTPQYAARGLRLTFGPWDPKRGVYESAELEADILVIRGLEVRGLKARLEGVDLVAVGTEARLEDVRLLRLDRLSLESAQLSSETLAAWLAVRIPGVTELSVALDGTVRVGATLRDRLRFSAEASLVPSDEGLRARVISAKVGSFSLPLPAAVAGYDLSFRPNPELPFELRVAGLTPSRGRLTIP